MRCGLYKIVATKRAPPEEILTVGMVGHDVFILGFSRIDRLSDPAELTRLTRLFETLAREAPHYDAFEGTRESLVNIGFCTAAGAATCIALQAWVTAGFIFGLHVLLTVSVIAFWRWGPWGRKVEEKNLRGVAQALEGFLESRIFDRNPPPRIDGEAWQRFQKSLFDTLVALTQCGAIRRAVKWKILAPEVLSGICQKIELLIQPPLDPQRHPLVPLAHAFLRAAGHRQGMEN